MSVFLQNEKTQRYIGGSDEWTDQPEQAQKFGGGTAALVYCCQHHLHRMKILGRFDDPAKNFTIILDRTRPE